MNHKKIVYYLETISSGSSGKNCQFCLVQEKKLYCFSQSNGKSNHGLNIEAEAENENPDCINWDHVDQWT